MNASLACPNSFPTFKQFELTMAGCCKVPDLATKKKPCLVSIAWLSLWASVVFMKNRGQCLQYWRIPWDKASSLIYLDTVRTPASNQSNVPNVLCSPVGKAGHLRTHFQIICAHMLCGHLRTHFQVICAHLPLERGYGRVGGLITFVVDCKQNCGWCCMDDVWGGRGG